MGRGPTPIATLQQRLPEQGRIRLGVKGQRGAPQKLDKFRFTSQDQAAIIELANLYGGVPQPWQGAPRPGEWEVVTEARSIPIVLPPDPLGDSPVYELWSGGGRQRSCDGETCTVPQQTPDGATLAEVPCLCLAREALACKVTTRLNVILRTVRFAGVWRLESHGWNAAQELPGMVAMIETYQAKGIVRGVLSLSERKAIQNGKTSRFVVPTLGFEEGTDIEALARGDAALTALVAAQDVPRLALVPGGLAEPAEEEAGDGEIVDADLVEPSAFYDETLVAGVAQLVSGGQTSKVEKLSLGARRTFDQMMADLDSGRRKLTGYQDDGTAIVRFS